MCDAYGEELIARDILRMRKRWGEPFEQLNAVLGESCISCELELAGFESVEPSVCLLSLSRDY